MNSEESVSHLEEWQMIKQSLKPVEAELLFIPEIIALEMTEKFCRQSCQDRKMVF